MKVTKKQQIILLLALSLLGLAFMTVRSALQYMDSPRITGRTKFGSPNFNHEHIEDDSYPWPGTGYLVTISLSINGGRPSFWDRFTRWKKAGYHDQPPASQPWLPALKPLQIISKET